MQAVRGVQGRAVSRRARIMGSGRAGDIGGVWLRATAVGVDATEEDGEEAQLTSRVATATDSNE